MSSRLSSLLVICLLSLLTACASKEDIGRPKAPQQLDKIISAKHATDLPNFAGHWEKNYQASDNFTNRFQLYIADIRRQFERGGGQTESVNGRVAGGVDANAINGLAQFSEEITRMPQLNIKQDDDGINVERENDFNLRCKYHDLQLVQSGNAFGNEICGWNGNRLMFRMNLAGGLHIMHQLSMSQDGSQLNVTTTLTSDQVSVPIIISNYYTRFDSQEDAFDCQQTLTRNKVCTRGVRGK